MDSNRTTLPAMNVATLARLAEILTPYRAEILSASTVALAYRLATLEAMQ